MGSWITYVLTYCRSFLTVVVLGFLAFGFGQGGFGVGLPADPGVPVTVLRDGPYCLDSNPLVAKCGSGARSQGWYL